MQNEQYMRIQDLLEEKKQLLKEYKRDNRSNQVMNTLIDKIAAIREVLQLIRE